LAHPLTLPTLGVMVLAGAGAGFHLGWSAVAEINPLYFSKVEAPSRFYGDLAPNRNDGSSAGAPIAEQADRLALGSGCIGCRTYPVDYRPVPDPAIEQVYAPVRERAPPAELAAYEQEAPEQAERRKADLARVELYSRAPVTIEEVTVQSASVEVVEAVEPAS
jgi:hypothetical protein